MAIGIFSLMLTVIAVIVATVFTQVSTTVREGKDSASNTVNLTYVTDLLKGAVSPANAASSHGESLATAGCWGSASPSLPTALPVPATQADSLAVVSAHDFDVVLCAYRPNTSSGTPAVYEVGIEPATCGGSANNGFGTACTLAVIDWGTKCNPGTLAGCSLSHGGPLTSASTCRPGKLTGCTTSAGTIRATVVFRLKNIGCDKYCQGKTGALTNGSGKVAMACADAVGATCTSAATPRIFGYFAPDTSPGQYAASGAAGTNTPLNDATLQKTDGVTLDLSPQTHTTTPTAAEKTAGGDLLKIQEIAVQAAEVGASESALNTQVRLVNQINSGFSPDPLTAAMLALKPDAFYPMSTSTTPAHTVRDTSNHAHTATAHTATGWNTSGTGATATTGRGPSATTPYAKGLEFTKTKKSHVTTPLDGWTTGTSTLTVAAWFQSSVTIGLTYRPRIVASGHTDATHNGFELEVTGTSGGGFFAVGNGTTYGSADWKMSLKKDTWYFYVGTYTGTTVNAYIDGSLVATMPWRGGRWTASSCHAGGTPVAVGWDPCYTGDALSGYVADVGLYTTALSATQIEGIYESTGNSTSHQGCLLSPMLAEFGTVPRASSTPPAATGETEASPTAKDAALYPLSTDAASKTVADVGARIKPLSGGTYTYPAIATASKNTSTTYTATGPTACNSHQGHSMKFTGTHLTLPSTPFGATHFKPSQLSVQAWVKFSTLSGSNPRVVANDHTDATTTLKGFELEVNTGGKSGFFIVGNGSSDGCAMWSSTVDPAFPTGLKKTTWYDYVGTYNGSTVQVYVDGQLMASTSVGEKPDCGKTTTPFAGGAVGASTKPISIGYNPRYGSDFAHGLIADVAILPVGLTGSEIVGSYEQATTQA